MSNTYRVKYKIKDLEIEVESTDKSFVDHKLNELLSKNETIQSKERIVKQNSTIKKKTERKNSDESTNLDLAKIVSAINDDDEHDKIEENILNKSATLPKIILCLKFSQDILNEPLTSGHVQTITDQLGVKIASANAGTTIKNNQKYFTSDSVRKKGAIMRYKLNRKGKQAYEDILSGKKI